MIRASPEVAGVNPDNIFIVVDFPAPFCPRSASSFPSSNVMQRSFTAIFPFLNFFLRLIILIAEVVPIKFSISEMEVLTLLF